MARNGKRGQTQTPDIHRRNRVHHLNDEETGLRQARARHLCHEPHGHWKTTTFVGGLTSKGIIAPMLLDGAINGDCFEAYVDQVLSKATKPGDLVILDNLSSHKTTKVRKAFE